jgi:Flp pilus assembly protein TadG
MNQIKTSLQKGQTLVEFALLLPVLLFVTFVIIDLGRGIYYYSSIHNAAREGVRYGIIHPCDEEEMIDTAVNYAFGLGLEGTDVAYAGLGDPQTVDGFPNPTVRVRVNYTFTPATPLVSNLLPDGELILTSEAIMRTETFPSCP